MSELDLLRFPLYGRRLIEASAGTGKTYSITALHLRALLGHGMAAPVPIDRILVMTFTEAATDSLRERVRSRIADVRDALAQVRDDAELLETNALHDDAFIAQLLPQVDDPARALGLLRAATTLVDTAAIHTLHGFCMRALREQAFASGAPFAQAFAIDDSAQVRVAATDAWRRLVRHPDATVAGLLLAEWKKPDDLRDEMGALLRREDVALRGVPSLDLDGAILQLQVRLRALAGFLRADGRSDALLHGDEGLLRAATRLDLAVPPMRDALLLWLHGGLPPFTAAGIGLRKLVNACANPRMGKGKQSALVDEMIAIAGPALSAIDDLLLVAFAAALEGTRDRLRRDKLEQGVIGPDDLLRDMLAALQGPGGERFAAGLRERYPVAMVDEFQDTDSVQWRILNAIYPPSSVAAAPACILIGDPKQSIYGFRGADVYSYLQAAASVDEGSRRELRRSFRASPELVRALNRLYRDRDGFAVPEITYREVESALVHRPPAAPVSFTRGGQPLAPLRFEFCADANGSKRLATGTLLARMARATAWRIRMLLDDDVAVDGKPLRADHIAVLVRNWSEGRRVRDALRAVGLDAAFQSQDSVFASDTARELRFALHAALAPEDETRLRAFALTGIGGMSARELAACPLDSPAWQHIAERFRAPLPTLHDRGVLAWMRQWLREDGAATRVLGHPDGRRRFTDIRHLCELLEAEWRRTRSVVQVADWLDARIDAAAQEKEETRLLRLDSDEGLIRIRTLHGAKGLEYDVVFLPFQWTGRRNDRAVLHERVPPSLPAVAPSPTPRAGSPAASPPPDRYRAYVDLSGATRAGGDPEALREAVLAEDLRLLYVGLTRARRACYVGVACGGAVGTQVPLQETGLGHLLFPALQSASRGEAKLEGTAKLEGKAKPEDLRTSLLLPLELLAAGARDIAVDVLPPEAGDAPRLHAATSARASTAVDRQVVTPFHCEIPDRWRISSYSSIVARRYALEPMPGVADEAAVGDDGLVSADDPATDDLPAPPPEDSRVHGDGMRDDEAQALPRDPALLPRTTSSPPGLPFHMRFPRGPAAGSLLHDVLERWDQEGDRRQRVESLVRSHGFARASPEGRLDIDALIDWMRRVREMPIAALAVDGEAPSLASLRLHAEVEFTLPLKGGDVTALDAVLRRHGYASEALDAQPLQGLLKGYMDLVFAWRGRYVVLDYKSNHLGNEALAYTGDGLLDAMRAHRYELQLLIYAVALRRWLRQRGVADARPEGIYWFVRGIDAPGAGLWHHVPTVAVLDDLDAVFDGLDASGAAP